MSEPNNVHSLLAVWADRGTGQAPQTLECYRHGEQYPGPDGHCEVCERERGRRQAALAARLEAANLPKRFRGVRLASYRVNGPGQEEARQATDRLLAGDRWALILTGSPGTGKTHLGAALVHEWEEIGWRDGDGRGIARYTTAEDLVQSVKDTWGKRETTQQVVMDRYVGAGLLVVDELGAGWGSDAETKLLSQVVADRYAQERATVLVSNLDMHTIKGRPNEQGRPQSTPVLDERAVDRLREGGQLVVCDWASERRLGGADRAAGEGIEK